MRASSSPRARGPSRAARLASAALLAALGLGAGAQSRLPTGAQALEPAFRLPAGGRALAGPLVEGQSPSVAWMLSEDGSLYALTEGGTLQARVPLKGKAAPYLALDPFGRALCVVDGRLQALTRSGTLAFSLALPAPPSFPPAFGSDGRIFLAAGAELLCLNPAGRRLWSFALPAELSAAPAADAAGRPALALADGSVLVLTPYGERAATYAAGAKVLALAPMAGSTSELPTLAAAGADGSVLMLDAAGALKARFEGGQKPCADLAWDGALLYALDAGGKLSALTAAGKALWSLDTRCLQGRIALFPERIVVAGRGRAVSLSPEGLLFREISISNAAGSPAISPSGLLFAPGDDWILAAYRFEAPLGRRRGIELEPYPDLEARSRKEAEELLLYDSRAKDSDHQSARLSDIENKLRSGSIGVDEAEAAAYCAALADRSFDKDYPEAERRFRDNPLPRARACAILGELGSPDYRALLARVLAKDSDSAVRDAACDALAAIGVDPGGVSGAAFLAAARAPAEERTALSLIAAIERMALRSGTAPSRDSVGALLALAAKPYGPSVRDRAALALGRIAGAIEE